jgi:hypothetical protein
MTLFQIIQAIWQGFVVEFVGCDVVGVAKIGEKVIASWDEAKPEESWMDFPDGRRECLDQLLGEEEPMFKEDRKGDVVCPCSRF